jgi:hypothetical protein
MNNIKISNFQKIFSFNFASKAKIKFIGKRSLLINNKNTHKTNDSNNYLNNQTHFSFTAKRYTPSISEEECEIINNGGPLFIADWKKIKLNQNKK